MKLKEWQEKNNITNMKLAKMLGISTSLVTYWHQGKRNITPEMAAIIEQKTHGVVNRLEVLYPE